jgi:hypothetical protein
MDDQTKNSLAREVLVWGDLVGASIIQQEWD